MYMKHIRIVLILFIFSSVAVVTHDLNAQDPSIQLHLSPRLQQGLEVVYWSDLDILKKGVADFLFYVEFYDVVQDWPDTEMELNVLLDGAAISTSVTGPFTLFAPDVPMTYVANNIDLLTHGVIPESGSDFDFETSSNWPSDEFENYLFQSGRLQRGVYLLEAVLRGGWGESRSQVRLIITNPSLVRLQTPGNGEIVPTEFPLIGYESDATQFIVYVYKRVNVGDDIETVLSGHPTLEYQTNQKQFRYSITDGDPLESGATYFWYVVAQVFTSNGLEDFRSQVWQFTVDTEGGLYQELSIKELLEPLLGDRAEEVAKQLTNYQLRTIRLNGEILTVQELIQVINNYQDKKIEIKDLVIQ